MSPPNLKYLIVPVCYFMGMEPILSISTITFEILLLVRFISMIYDNNVLVNLISL
jgi:hypothetical protein